ncbi:hypothetical protein [Bradyrhizobium erythrophlei]|uniref:Uncharacterized protein n=1 Tax=Bradyrhizobium erythrophlei TaxID=1437360 RepID=A0A1M5PSF0_9BRAD|nr:hypothetical protein [Bradyrhizobium erythrophlei]SHH04551.1 hypothetical protein SAMN05443248_3486 [Bradyrhizobium erythrophlei]
MVCGLPWLSSKPEKTIFAELQFDAVYAVGPSGGRPLRLACSHEPFRRIKVIQLGYWNELQLHHIVWTAGELFANRIFSEVAGFFDKAKRRLTGDWFDVTPDFAVQAIRLASDKSGVPILSHGEMLEKVRAVRKKKIEDAIRAS